jgi:hypothetical protein
LTAAASSQGRADGAGAVREALRGELTLRGYPVASDTISLRGELYVRSAGDRAAGIFEVKETAAEAAETMYQGRWTADLPPRFAVLPAVERCHPETEFLEQAGLSVLFFEVEGQGVVFLGLERALEKVGPPGGGDAQQ